MITINYPEIILKKAREDAILRGHPWIFSGAIGSVKGNPGPGDIVLARDAAGHPLALGFFNPSTDIAFRVLTRDATKIFHRISGSPVCMTHINCGRDLSMSRQMPTV